MSELVVSETIRSVTPAAFGNAARTLADSIAGLEPLDAFHVLDTEIMLGVQVSMGSMLYTIHAVCLAHAEWEQLDVSQQYTIAPDFYDYVSRRFGVSQNSTTVDNYINTAKTWLVPAPRVRAPEKVFLYEISKTGVAEPITNDDGVSFDVPVSVWDVSYSKMLVSNARAAGERMTEEDWGLFFNPDVTQDQLISAYHGAFDGGDDSPQKNEKALRFRREAGMLYVTDGYEEVELAELFLSNIENSNLAFRGWQTMRRMLSVEQEEDF